MELIIIILDHLGRIMNYLIGILALFALAQVICLFESSAPEVNDLGYCFVNYTTYNDKIECVAQKSSFNPLL